MSVELLREIGRDLWKHRVVQPKYPPGSQRDIDDLRLGIRDAVSAPLSPVSLGRSFAGLLMLCVALNLDPWEVILGAADCADRQTVVDAVPQEEKYGS